MHLHDLAVNWAEKLCANVGREDDYQKALTAYAIEGYLAMLLSLALLALAGWLIGAFWSTMTAAAVAYILKSFTGGLHLKSPTRCALFGAACFCCLGLLAKALPAEFFRHPIAWGFLVFDNLLVWLYAPVESPAKPLQPGQRKVLGVVARLLITAGSVAALSWPSWPYLAAVFVGATFQTLSLSRSARWLVSRLDTALSRLATAFQGKEKAKEGGVGNEESGRLDRSRALGHIRSS